MQAQWISIESQVPAAGTVVLVTGVDAQEGGTGDRVYAAARLVDAWTASEEAGHPVETWAEDATSDELTFDVTHWQPIQALN